MKVLDRLTREVFSWFDLVFVLITFTLARDLLPLDSALQVLAFVAIAAVVATERVWLRNWISKQRAASAARESTR